MYNFKIVATAAIALFSAPSFAQLTPAQIATDIGILTAESNTAYSKLAMLSNAPTYPQFSTAVNDLTDSLSVIKTDISNDVDAMSATTAFTDAEADPVLTAFNTFVTAHTKLLDTIFDKHVVFAQYSATYPIRSALLNLEGALNSFTHTLVSLIPTKQGDVMIGQNHLSAAVTKDIDQYSQLCIPSPLYPTVKPVCNKA
ncbi:hypothetical protein ABW20_dc0103100 [Dactylellina cionopaga]|nr:hypothetical protein ABW20_dc0103100 [Dactylellina cionopaga]